MTHNHTLAWLPSLGRKNWDRSYIMTGLFAYSSTVLRVTRNILVEEAGSWGANSSNQSGAIIRGLCVRCLTRIIAIMIQRRFDDYSDDY